VRCGESNQASKAGRQAGRQAGGRAGGMEGRRLSTAKAFTSGFGACARKPPQTEVTSLLPVPCYISASSPGRSRRRLSGGGSSRVDKVAGAGGGVWHRREHQRPCRCRWGVHSALVCACVVHSSTQESHSHYIRRGVGANPRGEPAT